MKITAFISSTLALAAFAFVNCAAENADKTAPEKDQRIYQLGELSKRPTPIKNSGPDHRLSTGTNRTSPSSAWSSKQMALPEK